MPWVVQEHRVIYSHPPEWTNNLPCVHYCLTLQWTELPSTSALKTHCSAWQWCFCTRCKKRDKAALCAVLATFSTASLITLQCMELFLHEAQEAEGIYKKAGTATTCAVEFARGARSKKQGGDKKAGKVHQTWKGGGGWVGQKATLKCAVLGILLRGHP